MQTKVESFHIKNSMALAAMSDEEFEKHRGQFAIVVAGEIRSFHETNREAITEARRKLSGQQYSVQKVEPQPVDVGFVDLANYNR
jgi:hypothetical protein